MKIHLKKLIEIKNRLSAQKEKEARMTFLAFHDYLTNLPNQRMFEKELMAAIENINNLNPEMNLVLMYIDIDGFKRINDTFGHLMGDRLLKEISFRLKQGIIHNELLARIGGDEFAVLIKSNEVINYPITLAKRIIASFKEPFYIDKFEFYITASIGISQYQYGFDTFDDLLESADIALFRAKEAGKNNYHIYKASRDTDFFQIHTIERDLRKAIKNEEFLLYYQPKVCAKSGEMVGAEALIRWKHPEWGIISPGKFIPVAEENGVIFELTDWNLRMVCKQIKEWEDESIPIVPISVNISPKRFQKDDWMGTFLQIIEETNVNPELLEFEITESTLIQNQEKFVSSVKILKEMGIKFSMDDFGTGYSSLLYLKRFMIDTVKIDQYFINTYSIEGDCPIAKHIIGLAHELNMKVVAEGVETEKQRAFLQDNGCDQIQGYLFSKPVRVEDLTKFLFNPNLKPAEEPGSI